MASIIDGKKISEDMLDGLKSSIQKLKDEFNLTPGLAVVIVGDDPASHTYVNMKEKKCNEVGMYSEVHRLPESISELELLKIIEELNYNDKVHGILVQLPLPEHINEYTVNEHISFEKDVDGFHPVNIGNLQLNRPSFVPCTPKGIIELIKSTGTTIEGKNAVVLGRSNIVGLPTAMLLLNENATVTICHSRTKNLKETTLKADIIVCATGVHGVLTEDMIKEGVIIVDAGIIKLGDKMVGDVNFDDVMHKTSFITPVPGGVGPMTIAMLMKNTYEAALKCV
ncbi:bifunctional 5,10-methylenetetrahydrofolate dehydrogenase/5,10-methenyltetrahydrofolate cyclohydrolase [Serpentinicella alkaliphila]|uniref:Bifunctional protein FolD n=1 Tax=Serpentinicella alkaliphila TaxID=1734049 RepID=A0A4R2TI43_9FIRM|nr:bifunctional 5,10-methylenetetrahydrofolate dehydrogenase/5,10-methenyltetrahydrofolate cyclohydrolase [Serpentinicella alkaliphila]TCQ02891.1 methenyltetrahydrofolate cyclohydrolase /5,10-methylenetetrahydrofolate dehydrogenase (NADP+) [Serpentinicella alkaliphila]